MSNEADTFTMTLAGRRILFRKTHVGQIMMLQRTAMRSVTQAAEEGQDELTRINAVSTGILKVLDFIDKLIVNPGDRQFIEDKMLEGTITWEQLVACLGGGRQEQEVADDEAPQPKKTAAKRTPRAASAAKTAVTRGRAKR